MESAQPELLNYSPDSCILLCLPLPLLSPHDKCTSIWEAAPSFNYILIFSLAAEAETAFKVLAKFWPFKIQ